MKISAALYVALGTLGLVAVLLVPIVIYRSGTPALPFWESTVSPGPLSTAHAFLNTQCESCHIPNQGIKAVSCITCHAPAALLLEKQSTEFHTTIGRCGGCHLEHQGVDRRPIKMDHSILTLAGLQAMQTRPASGQLVVAPISGNGAAIRHFLAGITGGSSDMDAQALDCNSCHSLRDKHQGFFGQQCADCHTAETWKIAGFLHPSPRSEDCNQCHKPPPSHYMMHFAMMDQGITGKRTAVVEQCFACHKTNSFNDIRGLGWIKMH
jgi:hypothetical protein